MGGERGWRPGRKSNSATCLSESTAYRRQGAWPGQAASARPEPKRAYRGLQPARQPPARRNSLIAPVNAAALPVRGRPFEPTGGRASRLCPHSARAVRNHIRGGCASGENRSGARITRLAPALLSLYREFPAEGRDVPGVQELFQAMQRPGTSAANGLRGAVFASRQTGFFRTTGPEPGMIGAPVALGNGRRSPFRNRTTGVTGVCCGVAALGVISSAKMKDWSATPAPRPTNMH